MGKTKGRNQAVKLTPENYIIKRGRTIPIHKCYINEGWNETGIAVIYISRIHKNGFITYCSYLVDLLCLGVTETYYEFNIPQNDMKERFELSKDGFNMVETDYTLVHNIIYGALAFAEDHGFSPHKDFRITREFLEEDTEAINMIDIEFGYNDKPCLMVNESDQNKGLKIKTLKKNATEYRIEYYDNNDELTDKEETDGFDDDDNDKIEEFDDDFSDKNSILDFTDEDFFALEQGEKDIPIRFILDFFHRLYDLLYPLDENETQDFQRLYDTLTSISIHPKNELLSNIPDNFVKETGVDTETFLAILSHKPKKMLKDVLHLHKKYPDEFFYYRLLDIIYVLTDKNKKRLTLLYEMNEKFPHHISPKIYLAEKYLSKESQYVHIPELLNNHFTLQELQPDRLSFGYEEVLFFYKIMIQYYGHYQEINKARTYLFAINDLNSKYPDYEDSGFISEIEDVMSILLIMSILNVIDNDESKKRIEAYEDSDLVKTFFKIPENQLKKILNTT